MREEEINIYIQKSFEQWADSPLLCFGGLTPRQIIGNISILNEAIEYFKIGSIICEKDLPEILLSKMKSFGEEAENELIRFASDTKLINDDEKVYISVIAIRTIGQWKLEKAAPTLIQTMDYCSVVNEIVIEEAADALISIGSGIVNLLIDRLETHKEINYIDEYLLTTLVKICKVNKSDRVLNCLKGTFNKMEDKLLGAMCLGDYGDWRAIPALRGFLNKHGTGVSKETYLEIKAAIKRLGGDISDI
jgi:hypothetical protein